MRFAHLCRFFLAFIFLGSSLVEASQFTPEYYYTYQSIDEVDERVYVNLSGLYVYFKGVILLNESILNKTDYIVFSFCPKFASSDTIVNYADYVIIKTPEYRGGTYYGGDKVPEYVRTETDFGKFIYNISIASLEGRNYIFFSANFTIKDRILKTRDYDYSFYYFSNIKTVNQNTYYIFPYSLGINRYSIPGVIRPMRDYQSFVPDNENAKELIRFSITDIEGQKRAESREKNISILINLVTGIVFLLIGIFSSLYLREKRLYGEIELKKFKEYKRAIIKIYKRRK